jgi:DNA primase
MSLSFAFLPDGLDPDDLVRQRGVAELDEVIARQRPLIDVLFEREVASGTWSTPERRARLEHQIGAHVKRIGDQGVRQHYATAMRERLAALWGRPPARTAPSKGGARPPFAGSGRFAATRTPVAGSMRGGRTAGRSPAQRSWTDQPDARTLRSASLTSSRLVGAARPGAREALIVGTVLRHPWLLGDHAELLAALELTSPELARLRDGVLTALAEIGELDSDALTTHLARLGAVSPAALFDRFLSHRSDKFAAVSAERPIVEAGWMDAIRVHRRAVELRRALDAALATFTVSQSDEDLERIRELHRELAATETADAVVGGVAA